MNLSYIKKMSEDIKKNISKVIVGKENVLDMIMTSFFAGGHILLDDIPGVGKTMIAKTLAKSIKCNFKRIQFTPDLLPTDLTGVNYFNQKESEFVFKKGPIFSNIILADEINRATPRTQSSLLECMEEFQVTVDGDTKKLEMPFFVIATQNPIENHGTFPLPEAQVDRFIMKLKIGYPSKVHGRSILDSIEKGHPFENVEAISSKIEIETIQKRILDIKVNSAVKNYIMDIVENTRVDKRVTLGVSPRGSIYLLRAVQSYAAIKGRDFVIPDDVKKLAVFVLSHRLILKDSMSIGSNLSEEEVILDILDSIKVPIEEL